MSRGFPLCGTFFLFIGLNKSDDKSEWQVIPCLFYGLSKFFFSFWFAAFTYRHSIEIMLFKKVSTYRLYSLHALNRWAHTYITPLKSTTSNSSNYNRFKRRNCLAKVDKNINRCSFVSYPIKWMKMFCLFELWSTVLYYIKAEYFLQVYLYSETISEDIYSVH